MFFGSWRLKLRQADQAFRDGQLSEAAQRIVANRLQEYLPGRKLANKVAAAMVNRAASHYADGDSAAAWRQLDRANELVGETEDVLAAQQKLVHLTLQTAEADVSRFATKQALQRLEVLRRRKLGGEACSALEEVIKRLESARNLERHGRFTDAKEQLDFAAKLRPDLAIVQQAQETNEANTQACRDLDERLHRALKNESWSDALVVSEALLDLAPEHKVAKNARQRAWAEVGAASRAPSAGAVMAMANDARATTDTVSSGDTAVSPAASERFLLWVDAVGGYLVCLSSEVVIGQVGGAGVDIPILADLSRRHAKIRRDESEGYVLEPLHPVRVDAEEVVDPVALHDGDEIELGRVRLRFRQPHPLSCTARLEFVSTHRTQPTADAVLLMAESCVLGPSQQNHIVCRDFENDIVLFRRDGELHCRSLTPIDVDGRRCDGASPLRADSHVAGDEFSLTLEPC